MEVAPRVRIGPQGEPESFAHAGQVPDRRPRARERRRHSPAAERPPAREGVATRRCSSASTSASRRASTGRSAVTSRRRSRCCRPAGCKAAAYFHEAADYARSNTLDAHEEARSLYAKALGLYGPRGAPHELGGARRRLHELRLRAGARWPRLVHHDLMAARAAVGYANTLVYRRLLARLAGRRLNPIFEARPVALDAVARLEDASRCARRPRDAVRREVSCGAHMARPRLRRESEAELPAARTLFPERAEQDVRYLYAAGALDPRPRSSIPILRRATELDQRFEVAQFAIAEDSEMIWRTRPTLEEGTAGIVFKEYEEVLRINPGNVGAWAALGYMRWLLGRRRRGARRLRPRPRVQGDHAGHLRRRARLRPGSPRRRGGRLRGRLRLLHHRRVRQHRPGRGSHTARRSRSTSSS